MVLIPRARYALMRSDGAELAEFSEPRGALVLSWPFEVKAPPSVERGGEEPPGAFSEPFGPAFVKGFRAKLLAERLDLEAKLAAQDALVVEVQRNVTRDALGWSAAGVAVLAAAGSAWQSVAAHQAYQRFDGAHRDEDVKRYREEVQGARARAIGLGVTAGVAAVGSTLLFLLWD
jgi:hypothetical protein